MRLIRTLAICAALTAPALGLARAGETGHSVEAALIQAANTPEQHAALAAHYRAEAAEARQEAANHKSMSRSYAGTKITTKQVAQDHCSKLVELYMQQATQYDDLASEEDAAAKAK